MRNGILAWLMGCFRGKPLRVLFIGNSFTYYEATAAPGEPIALHDLPALLSRMAKSRGERAVFAGRITENGASLEDHAGSGRLDRELRPGRWDYVVLQEHSERAVADEAGLRRDFLRLDARIRQCAARTVLFSAWAKNRMHRVAGELARQTGALLVPVGQAWRSAAAERPEFELCMKDGVHAGPLGSYLSACTFFASLYGKSPESSEPSVVADDAEAVEDICRAQRSAGAGGPGGPLSADALKFIRAAAWSAVGVKSSVRRGDGGPGERPDAS